MYITLPQQTRCTDRKDLTRGPDPDRWLLSALPSGWSLHNFHFFVNWSKNPPQLGKEIWMTRLLHFDAGESSLVVSLHALKEIFMDTNGPELESLGRFCTAHGLQVRTMLLPEIPPATVTDRTPIWTSLFHPQRESLGPSLDVISLAELKRLIQKESGGPVQIGNKGLIYGTSAVECVLSKTDAAYPGDADAVVCDEEGVVQFVVEYKKHNLNSAIGDYLIHRYYPNPDGRKWQRLDAFVSHCQKKSSHAPFVVLYYSTKSPTIRLQIIDKLLTNQVIYGRDSGDWKIANMTENQVAEKVIDWIGAGR